MFLLRRTAARAITSTPSKALLARPRTIATFTPAFRTKQQQWSSVFQQRFYSDETTKFETAESAALEAESFAQTVPDAPVEDGLTPAQQEAQAPPTDESATVGVEQLQAAAENASTTRRGPPVAAPPNNILYVGNLYYEVSDDQLNRVFSRFGNLKSIKMIRDSRGMSRGFAYVEFEHLADAEAALAGLDMQVFEGRNLVVQFHKAKDETDSRKSRGPSSFTTNPPSKTIFIGNMSFDMSDKDLNDLFREIRNVIDVRVAIDRRTGQPRGFAHADFIDIASAQKAKELLDNKVIYGRPLRIDFTVSTPRPRRPDTIS